MTASVVEVPCERVVGPTLSVSRNLERWSNCITPITGVTLEGPSNYQTGTIAALGGPSVGSHSMNNCLPVSAWSWTRISLTTSFGAFPHQSEFDIGIKDPVNLVEYRLVLFWCFR